MRGLSFCDPPPRLGIVRPIDAAALGRLGLRKDLKPTRLELASADRSAPARVILWYGYAPEAATHGGSFPDLAACIAVSFLASAFIF